MSYNSERVYIEGRMAALFGSQRPDVPIGFKNTNFMPPSNAVYGELHILGGKAVTVGGSNGRSVIDRHPGIVQVTFFSPDEQGTAEATKCVDVVSKIFRHHRGRDSEGNVITFKAPERPSSGKIGGWDVTIIKIPFYRDELAPVG